jgi:hypothetical protein
MSGPTKIDICAGCTIKCDGSGRASITLVNDHGKDCHISDLNLPNPKPKGPYTVPAHGSLTIEFDCIPGKRYPYSPDCCGKTEGNPVIIVQ